MDPGRPPRPAATGPDAVPEPANGPPAPAMWVTARPRQGVCREAGRRGVEAPRPRAPHPLPPRTPGPRMFGDTMSAATQSGGAHSMAAGAISHATAIISIGPMRVRGACGFSGRRSGASRGGGPGRRAAGRFGLSGSGWRPDFRWRGFATSVPVISASPAGVGIVLDVPTDAGMGGFGNMGQGMGVAPPGRLNLPIPGP